MERRIAVLLALTTLTLLLAQPTRQAEAAPPALPSTGGYKLVLAAGSVLLQCERCANARASTLLDGVAVDCFDGGFLHTVHTNGHLWIEIDAGTGLPVKVILESAALDPTAVSHIRPSDIVSGWVAFDTLGPYPHKLVTIHTNGLAQLAAYLP